MQTDVMINTKYNSQSFFISLNYEAHFHLSNIFSTPKQSSLESIILEGNTNESLSAFENEFSVSILITICI